MFSLPSLAPQDSYTLWYTSSTSNNSTPHTEPSPSHDPFSPTNGQNTAHAPRRHHASHRTPLARLRLDEEYMERRKNNIQNFGSSWIKPPGLPKSLYQVREEKREMEEHQEAMRREAALAAELAEAEAEGDGMNQFDGMEGEAEEVRDLDDDVPDADVTGIGADDDDDDLDEDEENNNHNNSNTQEVPRGVLQAQVSQDVYREALARGQDVRSSQFPGDDASTVDDEGHSGMLQEEDLVHEHDLHDEEEMNMDADLDADVPDADEGYEHTDTEAELTSSEEESDDGRLPPQANSMVRSDGTQNSMDMGSLMSASSQIGASSSPRMRRPPRS